ncbi:polysaccharide deacetylase family protein [Sphingomonas prati]|uniref:Chitooligosaccharide deacetylase n=1 Tax=Sphingomonas prati TaxID=1843237 RepID=A0A7W9BTX9_9SPHN|nr:polysaccharide deacetylase family protein [Sphingomonas prati]MBB5730050.1 peptidoglycan/xylan/chitin deacetylase (PgdA/CDA1 family) [Sphingomonas prati]GGE91076.1 chitooligosaccharide deacetylase [Sphingomonas prati]
MIGACLAVAVVLLIVVGLWQIGKARCFVLVGDVVCHVATERPYVALTFDDGPTTYGVDAILPVLAEHRARATFFLIGAEMEKRLALVRRIVRSGHEIGNHSFDHRLMIRRSMGYYRDQITRTDDLIRRAGGTPGLFRPPNGKKLIGLPLVLREQHHELIMWNVEDPRTNDPAVFTRQIVNEARPGSIILVHAMYRANGTARAALPAILDGLEAKGLRVVTVSELIAAREVGER